MELSLTLALPKLLLLLLPLLCFLCLCRTTRKQPRADGLKAYPIIGTLPHFIKNQHRLVEWSTGVVTRCPTHTMFFNFKGLGLMAGAITANPANVEYFLKTNFHNYPKGEFVASVMEDFFGHGIFNSDGDHWLWQRKAFSYEFSKRSLRNFVVSTVRFEVVERLLPLLSRAELHGLTLDVQDVLKRFAFDNICCIAFDEPGLGLKGSAEFMHALNDAQIIVMARFMPPVKWAWRIKKLLNMEPERRMNKTLATIHGYVDRIVRERSERGQAGLARKDDFLSRFVSSGEHSDESLRDVVTNFILAGRDTTSSALTWFFWLVSNRHEVEDKIVQEICTVRRASSGGTDAAFSFDELREMHYLHAAITESMRLYPPVAMDSRCCQHDDIVPDGTFVGKGWQVSYNVRGDMGIRLQGLPTRTVARRRGPVPTRELVQVSHLPRWAEDVPRQGDGLHTNEVHRCVCAGKVQLPVCGRRGAARTCVLRHLTDGGWLADASEKEGALGRWQCLRCLLLAPLLCFLVWVLHIQVQF